MRNIQIKSATLAMWVALTLGVTNNADATLQSVQHIQDFNSVTEDANLMHPILNGGTQRVQMTHVGSDLRIAVHSQGHVEIHIYNRDTDNLALHPRQLEGYPRLTQHSGSWTDLSRAYQDRINREELSLLRLADAVRRDNKLSSAEKKKIFKRIEEHLAAGRRGAAKEWEKECGAALYHSDNALPAQEIFVSRDQANYMLNHGLVAVNTAFKGALETLKKGDTPQSTKKTAEDALVVISRAGVDCDRIIGVSPLIDEHGQREQIAEVIRRCDEAVRELRRYTDDRREDQANYKHAIDCVRSACDAIDRVHLKKDCVKKGGKCNFHPIYPFYPKHHKHHKTNPPGGTTPGGTTPGGTISEGNGSQPVGDTSQTAQSNELTQSESADILAQDAERQRVGASLAPLCFVDDNATDEGEGANRRISTQCCQTSDFDSEGKPLATQCCPTDKLDENGQPVLKPCSEATKVTELKPA